MLPLVTLALTASKPNFLIIFVDDLGMNQIQVPASQRRYSYTGNNGTVLTPHISTMASEGMVFQTWYSGAHLCSPSRASMMTGRLPIRAGIVPGVFTASAVGGLPKNETTMAAALAKVGYESLAIGKVRHCVLSSGVGGSVRTVHTAPTALP
jgi:arylsulfatase A